MTEPTSPTPDVAPETSPPDINLQPERTISPVAGAMGGRQRGRWIAMAALAIGCAVFYIASAKIDRPKPSKAPKAPARQVVFYEQAANAPSAPTLAAPGPDAPALQTGGSDLPITDGAVGDQAPKVDPRAPDALAGASASAATSSRAAQVHAMRASPLLIFTQDASGLGPLAPPASPPTGKSEVTGGVTELDQLRQGSALGRAKAGSIGDRNFLILAGTSIPCVLLTALDSGTPGYVSCLVPSDVYSDNGAVVLLEKGSKVLGEYRSSLRQGQNRLFVLWTRAVTPAGVAVTLASPAADALGRAGFDGALDTHFWQRFGGAVMLSIIDEGAYAATGSNSNGQSLRAPSDAAAVALQNSVSIAPSLRKAQGAQISILAAQDFDFSGVYGLRSR